MKPTLASLKAELTTIKRELAQLTERYRKQHEQLVAIKEATRPIVAYMDTQWPGDVGPELRRLKELCHE